MKRSVGGRSVVVLVAAVAALATGADIASAGRPVADTLQRVDGVVQNVKGQLNRTTSRVLKRPPARHQSAVRPRGATPRAGTPGGPGGYQPPLHGTNPHGQGTVGVTDLAPSNTRPLGGNPSGDQPQAQDDEEVVAGRARGEKDAQGYHGHITVAALLGNELIGVDTRPGQSRTGPLEAAQQGLLNGLCMGTQICLTLVQADSTTTSTSSSNRFRTAGARIGATGAAPAVATDIAESRGDASEDGTCQTTSGSSSVANARLGTVTAGIANASSSSQSCRGGSGSQTGAGQVITLNNAGVPITAPGCGAGTPDTVTTIPLLATVVCNASDINGLGETVTQAAQRYGVREALSVFAINAGGFSLAKLTTAAAESRSEAPSGPIGPPDDGGDGGDDGDDDRADNRGGRGAGGAGGPGAAGAGPDGAGAGRGGDAAQCSDGIDNDGDGRTDFPNDPGCSSAQDDSEANGLAFTGLNVLVILGIGLILTPIGLQLGAAIRRRPSMS